MNNSSQLRNAMRCCADYCHPFDSQGRIFVTLECAFERPNCANYSFCLALKGLLEDKLGTIQEVQDVLKRD